MPIPLRPKPLKDRYKYTYNPSELLDIHKKLMKLARNKNLSNKRLTETQMTKLHRNTSNMESLIHELKSDGVGDIIEVKCMYIASMEALDYINQTWYKKIVQKVL